MAAGSRVALGLNSSTARLAEPLKVIFAGMDRAPTPTYAEAVQDIIAADVVPELQGSADVAYAMAEDAQSPGGPHAGGPLSVEGAATLLLWTMENPPMYRELSERCYEPDRRQVRMFQKYLWLLVCTLKVLEPFPEPLVFRGVKLDLSAEYPKDKVFTWQGPASCTKSLHVLENPLFCGTRGPRTQFIIKLTQKQARDITGYSFLEQEDEVLLPPGCRFKVESSLRSSDGLVQVQILEQPSPYWILNLDPAASPSRPSAASSGAAAAGPSAAGGAPFARAQPAAPVPRPPRGPRGPVNFVGLSNGLEQLRPGHLRKTGAYSFATAVSSESLVVGEGRGLRFRPGTTDQTFVIGLGSRSSAPADVTEIDYAAHCGGDGHFRVLESGRTKFRGGRYAQNAEVVLVVHGDRVDFLMDGELQYTSQLRGEAELYAMASFYGVGAEAMEIQWL